MDYLRYYINILINPSIRASEKCDSDRVKFVQVMKLSIILCKKLQKNTNGFRIKRNNVITSE